MSAIEKIEQRIKDLEHLITIVPTSKGFSFQTRLAEAKYILNLLKLDNPLYNQ